MMGIGGERMNGKNLIGTKIPAEEVENENALVSKGYYGCRRDATRAIIRRGAAQLRSIYWFVETRRR